MQYDQQQPSPPRSEKRTAASLVVVTFIVGTAGVAWALNKRGALSYPSLRVESLILVDKDGAERLRMQGEGSAQVDVLSKHGKSVASIYSNGRSGGLTVHSQQGLVGLGNYPTSEFRIFDIDRNVRCSLNFTDWSKLSVASGDGRSRVSLEVPEDFDKTSTIHSLARMSVHSETPLWQGTEGQTEALGPDYAFKTEVGASYSTYLQASGKYGVVLVARGYDHGVHCKLSEPLCAALRAALQL